MDRSDYRYIRNLQQLLQAKTELKQSVALKEYELKMEFAVCKDALNPATYLNRLITKLYTMENLIKYFVKGYDFVKELFNRNNNPQNTGETGEAGISAEAKPQTAEKQETAGN